MSTKNMIATALYGPDLEDMHAGGALLNVEELEGQLNKAIDDLVDRFGPLVGAHLAITTMHAKGDEWGVVVLLRNQNADQYTPVLVGPVKVAGDPMLPRVSALIRPLIQKRGLKTRNPNLG